MSGNNSDAWWITKWPYCDNQYHRNPTEQQWTLPIASTLVVYASSQFSSRRISKMSKDTKNQDHKLSSLLKVFTQATNSRTSSHKHSGICLLPTQAPPQNLSS